MTEEWDALATASEELSRVVKCMLSLAEEARSLRAGVMELEVASMKNVIKMRSERRTADVNVVADQARTERLKHTDRIAHFEAVQNELKG